MTLTQEGKSRACTDCRRKKTKCLHREILTEPSGSANIDFPSKPPEFDDQPELDGQRNPKRKALLTDETRNTRLRSVRPSNNPNDPNVSSDVNPSNLHENTRGSTCRFHEAIDVLKELKQDLENRAVRAESDKKRALKEKEWALKEKEWALKEKERAERAKEQVERDNKRLGELLEQAERDKQQAEKDKENQELKLRSHIKEMEEVVEIERVNRCEEVDNLKRIHREDSILIEDLRSWLRKFVSDPILRRFDPDYGAPGEMMGRLLH
ncbi:uncharacterized protein Z519_10292 [Cladophialophora bantiana CBS 173.52]|uniref:Uncharacterized protein n=1 Tax=Cladophialophora bantiana (strain ATCC 10958 / CBS 173.52 / CDC B-1940 / NIH 8579) TaxID=1442370 RepID=A0A0D2H656_CLAB1|nr:uncharacterized protein Z519_10292 [Cladophialophora bantiana CBS 173.52]KIW88808.1 hypothetical protein Z519_10292 [Cladophialophora bantiana CBS 173.52]